MKNYLALPLLILAACAGCNQAQENPSGSSAVAPADNSKKNQRDRDPSALTPGDQGGSEADRTITQKIRQTVVKDGALSMNAKNVKIITVDGVVTLRGPVKSDQEKATIAAYAQGVDGVKRVDNQLELATN
jgi:hyperosmotically inducible periplasmic protein